MNIGKVVGNIVSTIKDPTHHGLKLMVVRFIDQDGSLSSTETICTDVTGSGIGDLVLVNDDGGAAQMVLDDEHVIIDCTIVGVIDHYSYDYQVIYPT